VGGPGQGKGVHSPHCLVILASSSLCSVDEGLKVVKFLNIIQNFLTSISAAKFEVATVLRR
jgi:hypothetical protein